jgi:hypothetical protein
MAAAGSLRCGYTTAFGSIATAIEASLHTLLRADQVRSEAVPCRKSRTSRSGDSEEAFVGYK